MCLESQRRLERIQLSRISDREKAVLLRLNEIANSEGFCYFNLADFSKVVGFYPFPTIKKIAESGWIDIGSIHSVKDVQDFFLLCWFCDRGEHEEPPEVRSLANGKIFTGIDVCANDDWLDG